MKKTISFFAVFALVSGLLCGSFCADAKPALTYHENTENIAALKGAAVFPEYHDSVETGLVSGVNDQRSTELCWAFTQNELIEAYVNKNTGADLNLSEQTMKFDTSEETDSYGFVRSPNGGGNEYISLAYLARGGVTLEEDEPFTLDTERAANPELLNYRGILKNAPVLTFSNEDKEAAIWNIKKLVSDYGAAGASIYYVNGTKYQDDAHTNYYYYGNEAKANHSVTIVGWDDNYPKENFRKTPQGNGAFIVKNSHGNSHNNNTTDIFFVSYYDLFITTQVFATAFDMENGICDNIHQYDLQGYTGSYTWEDTYSVMYATKYRKSCPGETLKGVSTFVANTSATVEIYVNAKDGSVTDSSKFTKVSTESFEYPGYYFIEFDPVDLEGEFFTVAVKVTAENETARFPVCQNISNYVETVDGQKEICYVTSGGFESFTDVCDLYGVRETVLVMKAFTSEKETQTVDSAAKFSDVKKGKWYVDSIDFAVTYGIFDGTSDSTFTPMGNMTRAQFVQVLANISGIDKNTYGGDTGYSDVPCGKWYSAAIKWATVQKIVSGVGDGKFSPDSPVTREQMCVMLVNYTERYLEKEMTLSKEKFADNGDISDWAVKEVYKCRNAQLISGMGDNTFAPKYTATRAMGAAVFANYCKKYFF